MQFCKIKQKKLLTIVLALLILFPILPLPSSAVEDLEDRYLILDPISGLNTDLKLYINKKSLDLDLSKTQNIRIRLKTKDLYSSIESTSSFKVLLYEVLSDSEKKFISSQNLTLSRKSISNRIISVGVGHFKQNTKAILFEIYDTSGNLINQYQTELTAYNLESQVLGGEGINIGDADCSDSSFNDCQLDYLFQRITFEAKPQKQISTRVVKGEDGLYKVTIPVPRSGFHPLGRRIHRKPGTDNDSNGQISDGFGDILNISNIFIGSNESDAGSITYNEGTDQIIINNNVFFGKDGKVGIGVEDPQGWLHIRGGDETTPSLIINPGILTTTPIDGAFEYDGSTLYFTKGSTRSELGARGLEEPQVPQGPIGPQGPAGSGGGSSLSSGGTINGDLIINGDLFVAGTVHAHAFNGDIFNGGIFRGTLQDPTFNGMALFTNNSTAKFNGGILIPASAGANKVLTSDASGNATWQALSSLPAVDSTTLDGLNSTQFLRSDTTDNFTSGVLITDAGTRFDVNGDLSIADTNISLDGASTTFTQSTGNISLVPATGSNLLNTIASGGEFKINTSDFVFNGTNARVGIGYINPRVKLDVNGTIFGISVNGTTANFTTVNATTFIGDGSQLTGVAASNGSVNHFTTNNSTINNSTINNSTIHNSFFNGTTTVDGRMIFTSNGYLQDPTFNGMALFTNNSTAKFNGGILIPASAGANKVLTSDGSGNATWQALSSLPAVDSTTLDSLDSLQFLRSDTTDNFTSGVLITDSGTRFDVNGDLSIADTNISLDGASTTFTQTTGAITIVPANGSNMNVRLDGVSDFVVDTNKLVLNNNGNLGLSYVNPQYTLAVNGTSFTKSFALNGSALALTQGALMYSKVAGSATTLAKGTNHYALKVNGNALAWEAVDAGGGTPGGSNTQFQFNDGGSFAGNGALAFTKASKTLTIPADAPLDINSTTVSIADTNISLDGASTTFTQTTGAIILQPATNVGISLANPQATLDINGSLAIKSSAIANITAGGGVTATRSIMKVQGSGGAVDISVNPQIAAGTDGQILVLKGVSDVNTVKIDNGTGISLTDSLSFTLGNKDTLTLIYDASDSEWIEISRSDK